MMEDRIRDGGMGMTWIDIDWNGILRITGTWR